MNEDNQITSRPGGRGPSLEKTAQTRRAIVAAALDMFLERGFSGTRMIDVAERGGIAKGTLYLYFEDKDALFEGVLSEVIGNRVTEISALQLRPKESARAFLERTILPMLRTLETSRWASVIRIVITEGEHFPALAATYRRLVLDPATAMIRDFASRAVSNGEMQSNALIQFPLMLVAPAVVATLWNGLFGAEDPMDAAAAFEAFLDLAFPSSDVIKAESG